MSRGAPRVVVISGGIGEEHEVSLAGGRAITAGLRELGCTVITCLVAKDGTWTTDGRGGLQAAIAALTAADVAIPALHGRWGEDGTVQGFLETVGVPYVGSGVLASATCMDKARTKLQLTAAGISVAPGRIVRADAPPAELAGVAAQLGVPLFVKPLRGGSSHGVSRVQDPRDVAAAVATAATVCDDILVEAELHGPEIDVGVLERPDGSLVTGPLLQIEKDPAEPFFTTTAKYASDRTRFLVPAPVDDVLAAALADLACRAFTALGCRGLARVDCFVDPARGPVVNEVNTFPGFTEHSQFPRMWHAAGMSFPALLETLLETARSHRSMGAAA